MPNVRTGVLIFNSGNNLIGGDYSTHGNLISGNKRHGINIDGEAGRPIMSTALGGCGFTQNNRIYGNRIGVDITGNQALPNGKQGIYVFVAGHTFIGGPSPTMTNVISANKGQGVLIIGPNPNTVDWRYYVRLSDTRQELKLSLIHI